MTYEKRKYTKSLTSIWDSPNKVTWPQYIAELVIYNRSLFIDKYKSLNKGKEWWVPISSEIRSLNQQAAHILSYFDNPEDDSMVNMAIHNHIKKRSVCKIGGYRQDKLKATFDEKSVVRSIQKELDILKISLKKAEQVEAIDVVKIQTKRKNSNRWTKFQD